jgi:hypothetical protein
VVHFIINQQLFLQKFTLLVVEDLEQQAENRKLLVSIKLEVQVPLLSMEVIVDNNFYRLMQKLLQLNKKF